MPKALYLYAIATITFFSYQVIWHLQQSLWLDEFTTVWVVESSLNEVFHRSYNYQGQSPLYYLIVFTFVKIFGLTDFTLRTPSLIAGFASVVLLFKILKNYLNTEISIISCLFFLQNPLFVQEVANARPYSLVLFAFLLCLYFVTNPSISQKYKRILFILTATLIFYLHYLYIYSIIFLAILYIFQIEKKNRLKEAILIFSSICFLCLATLPQLILLKQKTKLYEFAPPPSIKSFCKSLSSLICHILALLFACCISQIIQNPTKSFKENLFITKYKDNFKKIIFLFAWTAFPSLFLIASYFISGVSNFVDRYLLWQIPAATTIGAIFYSFLSSKNLKGIFLLLSLISAIILKANYREEWRESINFISKESSKYNTKQILILSGLIESKSLKWMRNDKNKDYLNTTVRHYLPNKNFKISPVPIFYSSKKHKRYYSQIISNLEKKDFWLIKRGDYDLDYFENLFLENNYKKKLKRNYDGVILYLMTHI